MYLKKTYRKQSGRTYLVIAQKYRNPTTNISTDRTIKSLGYLDELEKEYDDPIAHFQEVARQMTEDDKEKRPNPIVQMGLAMDADGIPLHYELFQGNTVDKETFRPVIGEVRRNYDTGRIIVVADMGIITGDNIFYLQGKEKGKNFNGYVFSFSVRGGTKAFKEYVLSDEGYEGYVGIDGKPADENADFKIKSRRIARDINVTLPSGKKAKKTVYEKQVVFWGRKYALKAQAEREEVLKKAHDLAANPQKYTKATSYGAAKYVKNLKFDEETGEVLEVKEHPVFDSARVAEEEKYDGYYAIVTSELDMSDTEVIETYRGLWEIEETFRVIGNPPGICVT